MACPLVPTVPHRLSGSCPTPRTVVPRGLQTPPRGEALAFSLILRRHAYLDRGLAPPRMTACTAHTQAVSGRARRACVLPVRSAAVLGGYPKASLGRHALYIAWIQCGLADIAETKHLGRKPLRSDGKATMRWHAKIEHA